MAGGRHFGLEIGVAVLLAGGWARHRQHPSLGDGLAAIGVGLLLVAAARPALLEPIGRRWVAAAAIVSRVTNPILLAVVYVGLITPIGLLRRTIGTSPLRRDAASGSYWIRRPSRTRDEKRAAMERRF
jgi:carbamoyltransferase